MYIIVSCLLKTCEISYRSTYKTRSQARKNLLKEAQNWLVKSKPNNEWSVISHKTEAKSLSFYIKPSNKNEDVISIYEKAENVQKGWLYNTKNTALVKIMKFMIVDITEVDQPEYILPIPKQQMTLSEKKTLSDQRCLISELKTNLAERRIFIE